MAMMRKRWNESLIEENSREAFCVFDADENDIISADDIAPLFTRLGHNLSQNQLQQVIAAADIDGDGTVTFEGSYLHIMGDLWFNEYVRGSLCFYIETERPSYV